jgi:glycosyltransferase involved in cell wall biosynthesis
VEVIWYLGHNSFFLEIPYIITIWDLEHRGQPFYPEVSEKGLWASRERHFSTAIRRAAVVITGSDNGKKEIERYYQVPPERIRVIPLPTPRFALNPERTKDKQILAEYHIPGGYLFYPAQFWPHKNHIGILKAVRLLKDKNISLPVVFVGSDKGNKQYIQKMAASLDLSSQVHFLGFVPTDVLIALYQHAFALVFPTFFGPDNLPPLEAFALGCPVIASDLTASREQFGEAALLVDPKSPEQLALAVKSLYDDEGLRSKLVRCGFERAKRWTGPDYVRSIFSILDDFEPLRQAWEL